jgi:hypothetical protein
MTNDKKHCSKCRQEKSLGNDFYRSAKSPDGRSSQCKICSNETTKAWNAKNRSKVAEKCARYRKRHPERVKASQKKFKEAHPERSEEIKRRSYQKHRAKNKERLRLVYQENREKIVERACQWQRDNPDKVADRQRRRHARLLMAPVNDLTHAQWLDIQLAYDHRCAYCGKKRKGKLTQEHITPLSKGGSHTLSNVVPACQSCNSKKHTGPPLCPVQPLLITVST